MKTSPSRRGARRAPASLARYAAAALLVLGCTDRPPTAPGSSAESTPGSDLQVVCTANLPYHFVRCAPATYTDSTAVASPGNTDGGALRTLNVVAADTLIELATTTPLYDAGAGTYTFDAQVINHIAQALGTTDGVTADPSGVRAFVVYLHRTGGTGPVSVANADGTAPLGTSASVPYYQYAAPLDSGAASAPKTWRFNIPSTVTTFDFTVRIVAEVQWDAGWLDIAPESTFLRVGQHESLYVVRRNPFGVPIADVKPRLSSGDSAVALMTPWAVVRGYARGHTLLEAYDSRLRRRPGAVRVFDPSPALSPFTAASDTVTAGDSTYVTLRVHESDGTPMTVGGDVVKIWGDGTPGGFVRPPVDSGDGAYTTLLRRTVSGKFRMTARLNGHDVHDTVVIVVRPAAPRRLASATDSVLAGVAGDTSEVRPAATVRDQFGNGVPGIPVRFRVNIGGGTLTSGATTDTAVVVQTDSVGVARVDAWTLGRHAGTTNAVHALVMTDGGSGLAVDSSFGWIRFRAYPVAGVPAKLFRQPIVASATVGSTVTGGAGVIVRDANGNPVPNHAVTFTVTAGGGHVVSTTGTTDADGKASAGDWTLGYTAGVNRVRIDVDTLAIAIAVQGTPGAAATIAKTDSATRSATAGTATATAPAVLVTDAYGNAVPGATVTFSVGSGGGSVANTSTTTDASGHASSGSWTLGTTIGANTLTASIDGGAAMVTFLADATADAPATATYAGDGQSATAGSAVTTKPSVHVEDQYGNAVAGVAVTFTVTKGGGSVDSATAHTNESGDANGGVWTLGTTAGDDSLEVHVAGLTAHSLGATGVAGAPATMTKTRADAGNLLVTATSTNVPQVRITDANGNPVSGVAVHFAVTQGNSVLGTGDTTTDDDGYADSRSWHMGTQSGYNTVTVSSTGLTSVNYYAVSQALAPSSISIVSGDNQSATVGQAVGSPLVVLLADTYGNPVPSQTVTFAVAAGGGSIAGGSAVTGNDGKASPTSWTLGTTAGANAVTATWSSLTATFNATGDAATAASVSLNAGGSQSDTIGAPLTPPSVLVTDGYGNPVADVAVDFSVVAGGGSASGTSTTTDGSGIATVGGWSLGTTPGTNTLRATANGHTLDISASASAGNPASFTVGGTGQSATVGTALTTAPSVTVKDRAGNLVSGASVDFTPAGGSGSVSGGSTTTNGSGVAAVSSWTLGTTTGTQTLNISIAGGALTGSLTATANAGAAASLTKIAGDGQSATVGTTVSAAPSVIVKDAYGNAVSGVSVTFAVTSGGGSLIGGAATSNGSGVATVSSWTLGTTAGSNSVGASASGVTAVTFTATGSPGLPASIAKTAGDAQTGSASTAVSTAPKVTVTDQYGNAVPSVTVTFSVAGGGGSVTGATPSTNALGQATVGSWTLGASGAQTLQASVSIGTASAVTFTAYLPAAALGDSTQAMGNATLSSSIAPNVLSNDVSGTGNALSVTTTGALTTARSGTVTMASNGTFSYVPPAWSTGWSNTRDSVQYTISDGNSTSTAWLKVRFTGKVWFVDNTFGGTATGTDAAPFTSISAVEAVAAANDTILIKSGSGTTNGGTLKNGQLVRGQGHSAAFTTTLNGSGVTLLATGTAPTVGALTLGSGNTLRGFRIASSSATPLYGTSVGSLTVSEVAALATNYPAVDISTGTVSVSLDSIRSTNSSTTGVNLSGIGGTVALNGTGSSISGVTGTAFNVSNGSGTISYAGTISKTNAAGNGIVVSNMSSGSATFSGSSIALSTGASNAVYMISSGATLSFTGGALSISTTGGTGFYAGSGGTVNVTGSSNVIAASGGQAMYVSGTTIGGSGLTFRSISSAVAGAGISLSNTGSSGGLTVTGTGTAGSGGTLTNATGISLSSTTNPSFSYMSLSSNSSYGINGSSVSGLALDHVRITGTGNTAAINLATLTGSATISNSRIEGGTNNLKLANTGSSSLDRLTLSYDTLGTNNTSSGFAALDLSSTGGTFKVTVGNSKFEGARTNLLNFAPTGGTADLVVQNSALTGYASAPNGSDGIYVAPGTSATTLTYTIQNNTFSGINRDAIRVQPGAASSTITGYILSNTIGSSGSSLSGSKTGDGIDLRQDAFVNHRVKIDGNTIYQVGGTEGIGVYNGQGTTFGDATMHVTVSNNTVSSLPGSNSYGYTDGLHFGNGGYNPSTSQTAVRTMCVKMSGNSLAGAYGGSGGGVPVSLDQSDIYTAPYTKLYGWSGISSSLYSDDPSHFAALVKAYNSGISGAGDGTDTYWTVWYGTVIDASSGTGTACNFLP